MKSFIVFAIILLSQQAYSNEKVFSCKMNYGISGENDETDIEFKNLSDIDQTQTLYLDLENNWLSIQSFQEYKNSNNKLSKIDFSISDSLVFSLSFLQNDNILVSKNIIELDRYSGFVKHEFRTNSDTIYRTGYCKLIKKKMF